MKKLLVMLGVILLFSLPLTALAQTSESDSEERDVLEFQISGGISNPMGGVKTWNDSLGAKLGLGFVAQLGYFLSPNLVLGASCGYHRLGIESTYEKNDQKHQIYNPALYLKYFFFGDGNLAPFIQGNIGADFLKFSTLVHEETSSKWKYRELGYKPALAVGGGAGLFYYTTDYSGCFVQVSYHHGFTKDVKKNFQGVDYVFGENVDMINISVGVQVFFSGK
jgi:hypothetical protein